MTDPKDDAPWLDCMDGFDEEQIKKVLKLYWKKKSINYFLLIN